MQQNKKKEIVTMSSKGQIVIPQSFREFAHLEVGSKLLLSIREDGVIEIAPSKTNLSKLFSIIPAYKKLIDSESQIANMILDEDNKTRNSGNQ